MATRTRRTGATDRRTDGKTDGPPHAQPSARPPDRPTAYRGVFPNSHKVYLDGPHGIRVPLREISLAGGEPPLRVYDTSGPEGHDVREGLPRLREAWVRGRDVARTDRRTDGQTDSQVEGLPSVLPSV